MNAQVQHEHYVDPTLQILQLQILTSTVLEINEHELIVPQAHLLKSLELILLVIASNAQEDITALMLQIQQRSSHVLLQDIVMLGLLQPQELELVRLAITVL